MATPASRLFRQHSPRYDRARPVHSAAPEGFPLSAEHHLLFRAGETLLATRLLDGHYPDAKRLIPTAYATAITVDRLLFTAACERAALAARDGAIALGITASGVQITAQTPEVGQVSERVPGAGHGPPLDIALNVRYALEGLRSMDGPDLLLEFGGRRGAIRFRANAAATAFFAVMPLLM